MDDLLPEGMLCNHTDKHVRQAVDHAHHFPRRIVTLLQLHHLNGFGIEVYAGELGLNRLRLAVEQGRVQRLASLRVGRLLGPPGVAMAL